MASFIVAVREIFKGNKAAFLVFLIFGLSIYTTAMSVAYTIGLKTFIPFFQFFKEILVLCLLGASLFSLKTRPRFHLIDYLIFTFLALTVVYAILPIGEQTLVQRLLALKSISFFIIVYFAGRFINIKDVYINKYFSYVGVLAIAAGIVCFFEVLFNQNLQTITGYADYVYYFFNFEPSGTFGLSTTFESEGGFRRFASFFANPLEHAAASILALSLLLALYTQDDNRFKFSTASMATIGATFFSILFALSRAPLASYFLVVYVYALITRKKLITQSIHLGVILVACYFLYLFSRMDNKVDGLTEVVMNTIDFSNPSSVGHILQWVEGIMAIAQHPFGMGLGTSGRVAGSLGDNTGGENQFIIIGVQAGVIALVLYLVIFVMFVKQGLKWQRILKGKERKICLAVLLFKIGFLIPLFTSELESSSYISYMNWFLSGLLISTIMQYRGELTYQNADRESYTEVKE
ncbi:O-antigen ligase family protein [Mucilaginibacter sp. KACC 22063]|uniref:O-antigen ligase family protein n=1 Tax=Mucilaginibacter sp. KACC 22063 TaxID=3025666 RepID=UPI0023673029|nr:O-antigen ligase family protein [Mucilaginibacter sp. KACC 22063]WDF53996.1 hypothetical protein PQ461_13700 [Mucilaginibacter sp. KACC 22063]